MKEYLLQLQSIWRICFPKLVWFFKLLKNLSLLWHHPFAALFILSLFSSPMRPIIRFFSPLIGITLLCIVAYISFGFLVKKSKEMQIGDEIEGLDVLRLGGGWATTHGWFKQETDSTLFIEQLESTTTFPTKDENFDEHDGDFHLDSSPMAKIVLSSIKESKIAEESNGSAQVDGLEQERNWGFEKTYDEFQEAIAHKQDGSLMSLTDQVSQRDNKIDAEFENDMTGMEIQGKAEEFCSQSYDGSRSSTGSEQDNEFSFFMAETLKGEIQIQNEDATAGLDKQEQQHDRECNFDSYDGHHDNSNLKPEDTLGVLQENSDEIEAEANMEEMVFMQDVAAELHCEFQIHSLLKQEGELKQEIESFVQIQGMDNCVDLLDHDQSKASNLCDKFHSDSKYESCGEVQIQDQLSGKDALDQEDLKQDSEVQIQDKLISMAVPDQEDLKQDSGLAQPQKWANWVRGLGVDGLLFCTSENDSSKIMDHKRLCTSFVEDITGFTSMEEDYVGSGAFTVADSSEGILLEELSAFIQEFTLKLQSCCEIEVESGQTRAMSKLKSLNDTNLVCIAKNNCASKGEIRDDFNAEEGDGSSSWDGALDILEKASDSENEDSEGQIWPLPLALDSSDIGAATREEDVDKMREEYNTLEKEYKSLQDEIIFGCGDGNTGNLNENSNEILDISDIGAATREEDVDRMREEYNALEKEYKSLQDEIIFGCGDDNAGSLETGKLNENSDKSLDLYVPLFTKCDLDVQGLALSEKTSFMIEKTTKATIVRDKPSVNFKSLLRMSRLNRIGRALRSFGKKRL